MRDRGISAWSRHGAHCQFQHYRRRCLRRRRIDVSVGPRFLGRQLFILRMEKRRASMHDILLWLRHERIIHARGRFRHFEQRIELAARLHAGSFDNLIMAAAPGATLARPHFSRVIIHYRRARPHDLSTSMEFSTPARRCLQKFSRAA